MRLFPRRLAEGYANFKAERLPAELERYRILGKIGQKPETLMISCCDSRAGPETVFSSGPGHLFTVRNVANLVPPYAPDSAFPATSAAIEYAIGALPIKNVVVMGHSSCGGVAAFLDPSLLPPNTPMLATWAHILNPAMENLTESWTVSGPNDVTKDGVYQLQVKLCSVSKKGHLPELTSVISEWAKILDLQMASADRSDMTTFSVSIEEGWPAIDALQKALTAMEAVQLVKVMQPLDKSVKQRALELSSIEQSLRNLESFPAIRELLSIRELQLFGAWFDIHSGDLLVRSQQAENPTWTQL